MITGNLVTESSVVAMVCLLITITWYRQEFQNALSICHEPFTSTTLRQSSGQGSVQATRLRTGFTNQREKGKIGENSCN